MLLIGHRKASDSHERDLAERMIAGAFVAKMLCLRGERLSEVRGRATI